MVSHERHGPQPGAVEAVSLLRQRNDELAKIEVLDTGKPWQEASVVDVVTGADAIEYFAGIVVGLEGCQQSVGDDFFYTAVNRWGFAPVSAPGIILCR